MLAAGKGRDRRDADSERGGGGGIPDMVSLATEIPSFLPERRPPARRHR